MEEGLVGGAHHGSEIEVVDMTFLNAFDEEADAQFIVRNNGSFDNGFGVIDFRAAIAGREVVGVGGEDVGFRISGDCGVDGEGEIKDETIRSDVDLFDLKGRFPGPVEALNGKRLFSTNRPLSAGGESSGNQLAFGGELDIHDAGVETFAEGIAGTLPHTVDLFGGGSHDEAEGVVTEEELILEGPEFSFGLIELEAGDGASHFDVGKEDGGRDEFLDALLFDLQA